VYAARDEFVAGAWLAGDKDAQVKACGNLDVSPDFPYQFGLTDKSINCRRAVYIWLPRPISTQPSSGQDLDAARGMTKIFSNSPSYLSILS
jgi:hypothetical protein